MNKQYILFDLDGTLIDSKIGILRCLEYALSHFGIQAAPDQLDAFVGPPLYDTYIKMFHGSHDEALEFVRLYRERFASKGVMENSLFPGVEDFLAQLQARGKTLLLATSKPTVFARQILAHYGLDRYFALIGGSNMDNTRSHKNEVIEYVLETCGLQDLRGECVMIGDRRQDVIGARQTGLDCIAVRYGYAAPGELEEAGAHVFAEDFAALLALLP